MEHSQDAVISELCRIIAEKDERIQGLEIGLRAWDTIRDYCLANKLGRVGQHYANAIIEYAESLRRPPR
jgi:hypothetical protein